MKIIMVPKRLALVCVTITILLPRGDAQLDSTIDTICRQTIDYDYCSSALHQSLPDGKPTTISGLNLLTNLQALARVTDALGAIRPGISREKDSSVVERLRACEDAYRTVEYNMQRSFAAFNKEDYPGMTRFARGALLEQSRCYEIFSEAPFDKHPVHQMSKEVMVLIAADVIAGTYLR